MHISKEPKRPGFSIVLIHLSGLVFRVRFQKHCHQKLPVKSLRLHTVFVQTLDLVNALHVWRGVYLDADVRSSAGVEVLSLAYLHVDKNTVFSTVQSTRSPLVGLVVALPSTTTTDMVQSCERTFSVRGYFRGGDGEYGGSDVCCSELESELACE